jgi:hypothetical protein
LGQLCGGDWIPELLWRRKLTHAVRWVILWASLGWDSPGESIRAFAHAISGEPPSDGPQLLLFDSGMPGDQRAPASVRHAFASSDSYGEVMARLLVSRSDIVRWLDRDPLLRAEWRHRLKQGKQAECAKRIRDMVSGSTDLTRQQLESRCGAEVRWLREHAPTLLLAMMKSVPGQASAQRHMFPRTVGPHTAST